MRSIKEPVPSIFDACDHLSAAVDAHLAGDGIAAAKHFVAADCPLVWEWSGPSSYYASRNVRVKKPPGDLCRLPNFRRDKDDAPTAGVQAALLLRDGYRCRYCGIPVVSAKVRKLAQALYPDAVRWKNGDYKGQHAGFQALWLQFDHVVPVSHGGSTSLDNLVVSCHLCNFGKWNYTLLQLELEDPRMRPPEPTAWDGLERFLQTNRKPTSEHRAQRKSGALPPCTVSEPEISPEFTADLPRFFLPGAWISKGYVYTTPIEGRARWFKIGASVSAESAEMVGETGVLMLCTAQELARRGIDAEPYLVLAR